MTRKDYIAIAGALQHARNDAIANADRDASHFGYNFPEAKYIADVLAADNSRFNRDHFLAVVRGEKALTSRP